MSSAEAQNREDELRRIPARQADPSAWPKGIRTIGIDEMDALGVDQNGLIYWHGKPIQTRRLIELRSGELWLLFFAAFGTMMQGVATFFPWAASLIK